MSVDAFDFTLEELIGDIWGQNGEIDGYFTTRELSEQWGISRDRVREILYQAQKAGYVVSRRYVKRRAIDGKLISSPAYRISKKQHDEE